MHSQKRAQPFFKGNLLKAAVKVTLLMSFQPTSCPFCSVRVAVLLPLYLTTLTYSGVFDSIITGSTEIGNFPLFPPLLVNRRIPLSAHTGADSTAS